jgi:hypothetical protein
MSHTRWKSRHATQHGSDKPPIVKLNRKGSIAKSNLTGVCRMGIGFRYTCDQMGWPPSPNRSHIGLSYLVIVRNGSLCNT